MSEFSESYRPGAPTGGLAPAHAPATICAITYIIRPQNLPPFYHAATFMTRAGYRVISYGVAGQRYRDPFEEVAPGFTFSRIPLKSRDFFHNLPDWLGDNILFAGVQYLLSFFEYNIRIFFRARKDRIGLVEAHDLPSLLSARLIANLRKCPLVYHAHELWPEMGPHIRFPGFWRWFEKRLIGGVDLIVVPEENRARIYREEYGARETPLVISNCPPFRTAKASTTLGSMFASRGMRSSCIVLYQGVLNSERCVDEIVSAAAYFNDGVALTLIGHGYDAWSDPEKRIPPGRNILYVPHVAYNLLLDYTGSAQIGLLFYRNTCRNNYYCAPNKLYEYMMMGLPVVTCNYPGLVHFVEGQGIGLCVDPEDPRAIADAVNRIAADEGLRGRMRENCLRLARDRWNWESEFAKLLAAYTALPGIVSPAEVNAGEAAGVPTA